MGDNRLKPGDLNIVIHPADVVWMKGVREFHQQVRSLIDGKILGILRADLNVVVRKVEVAPQQEFGLFTNLFLHSASNCRLRSGSNV